VKNGSCFEFLTLESAFIPYGIIVLAFLKKQKIEFFKGV